MTIYLTIMMALVLLAEVVRIIQNKKSLYNQGKALEVALSDVDDITQRDIDTQRKAYNLAVRFFENYKPTNCGSVVTGETSDGYHTFNELYHHRAVLFSALCNSNRNICWKSKQHHDPADPMYDGMFIVGIETPYGQATYHYDIDPYWDTFQVGELERAPKGDGHTPDQAIARIEDFAKTLVGSFGDISGIWLDRDDGRSECSQCGSLCHSRVKKCPICGANMKNHEAVYRI